MYLLQFINSPCRYSCHCWHFLLQTQQNFSHKNSKSWRRWWSSSPVEIRNGNTCPMTTSAPHVTQECSQALDSSVLIFFWCPVAVAFSLRLQSFILIFHSAALILLWHASIYRAHFQIGKFCSNYMQTILLWLSSPHLKTAVWIIFLMWSRQSLKARAITLLTSHTRQEIAFFLQTAVHQMRNVYREQTC